MSWHYVIKGDRRHPTLLLLHGFMGSHADWLEVTEMLGDHFSYVLPDLPGHGKTVVTDDREISMKAASSGLRDLVVELGLNDVVLGGYSMGGRVALHTALMYPQLFRVLIMESTTAGIEDESERRERAELDMRRARQLKEGGIHRFVEEWYDAPLFQSLKLFPEKLAALKQNRSLQDAFNLARVLRGLSVGLQQPLWSRLGQLSLPTLIISGALDAKYAGIAGKMALLIPNAEHVMIRDAGHNVHLEKPEAFAAALRQFLMRPPVSADRYAGKDIT